MTTGDRTGNDDLGQKRGLVLASIAMGVFLATIDSSIVNVSLPTMVDELGTTFSIIQWVVLAYLLTVTTLMLTIGRLADILGKKKIYQTGMVIFTAGSVLCGISTEVGWLIAFRVIQAVGAAMMMALGNAILTEVFPENQRGKVLGINGLMVSMGVITGPMLGGLILDALSWRWIFFVNIPVGLLGILFVQLFVPHIKPTHRQKFDIPGSLLLFVGLLLFSLAMTIGQNIGFGSWIPWTFFGTGLASLVIFYNHEKKVDAPLINLSLFKNRLFSINVGTGFLAFVASSGLIFLTPFFLQDVLGLDHGTIGLLMAVVPLLMGGIAPISGALSDKYGSRILTTIGLVVLVIAYLSVSTLDIETTQLGYILRFIPFGIGIGLFQSPNNSAIMGSVPRTSLGVASGLLSLTRTLGQTTGISVMGALWGARMQYYQNQFNALEAQVSALHDTTRVMVVIIFIALCFSSWALYIDLRMKKNINKQTGWQGK